MSLTTLPGRSRSRRQRLGLTLSAAVLPLTLAACGSTASTDGAGSGSTSDISAAYDTLMQATSASFTLGLDDPDGSLKTALVQEDDGLTEPVADAVVGGSMSMTLDPTGDLTLGDLQQIDPDEPLQDSLAKVNYAIDVTTADDDVLSVRLVDGALFAKVDLDTIDDLAQSSGSDPIGPSLDEAGQSSPELGQAITDLKAGQWLRLDLNPFLGQLESLAGQQGAATGMPQLDGEKLASDLLAAIEPFSSVTGGSDGVYDVEVQARSAVTAAAKVLTDAFGSLGGGLGLPTDELSSPDLGELRDGPLRGTVELDGDSLSRLTLDLSSVLDVAPPEPDSPNLAGSRLVLDIDDEADDLSVPDDVSDVDLNALVMSVFGGALGAGTPS